MLNTFRRIKNLAMFFFFFIIKNSIDQVYLRIKGRILPIPLFGIDISLILLLFQIFDLNTRPRILCSTTG